jgi:N-dimethylarginine dimethylaminohydrolase
MSLTLDKSPSSVAANEPTSPATHESGALRAANAPSRTRILMVSPEHFCVRYSINPWMTSGAAVDCDRAFSQWDELRRALARHADVAVLQGDVGLPDMCFSANAGLVDGATFVPSNFRHAERRPEAALFADWMRSEGFLVRELSPDIVFEGAGDALFDRDGRLWMGHGQRTDQCAAAALSGLLNTEVIPLGLIDPRFYHLDTCFCPLRSGHIVFYPGAFTPQSLDALRRFIPRHLQIPVTRADAMNFACNMVDLGDAVVAHHAGPRLRDALRRAGRDVITVDLSEFIKAGGGAKCLTLALGKRSVVKCN